jgi:hypothetical protein
MRVFSIAVAFRNDSLSLLIAAYLNGWRPPVMKGCGCWISQPYPAFGQETESSDKLFEEMLPCLRCAPNRKAERL